AEWLAGDMEMSNTAVINNSGDFFIQSDHEMLCCVGVGTTFNNTGIVFKTATSGTTLWQTPFDNTGGTLHIQSGTINFQGALTGYDSATHTLSKGSYQIDSPATMEMFSADIQTIGGNTSLTLDGPTSMILDASNTSNDGLRNLATVAATGMLTIQDGRNLTVPNGLSDAGTVAVGSGDTLTLTAGTLQVTSTGLLSGFGTVAGPVANAGVVSPGMQPGDIGDLTIVGASTQASGGVLRIEIEFTGSGEYDRLLVNGHPVTLSGTIEVVNITPFTPSNGDVITPLEYGTRSGQFATVSWTVPAGLTATAVYHPTSADIVVGPAASLGTPSMTKPTGTFQNKRTKFAVAWTAVSGTNIKYDVQMKSAPASTGVFGSFSQIKTGLNTLTFNFQGTQGATYCFEARASKGATHSAFSPQRCTSVPFDDRSLTRPAGTHWQLKKLFGYYLNTFLLTKTHNDSLTKANVHGKTVAVVAEVCPSCGAISVTFGGTTKAFDLHAATTKREVLFVVDTGSMHTGTVTIKVTSTNKNVQIDGLGASPQ
ncbi:MAG TPA: hypothetical protein VNN79_13010, partial [Actinomycetota bacterium]|nr:hypothetical protein [Actinomycetota bacterium]